MIRGRRSRTSSYIKVTAYSVGWPFTSVVISALPGPGLICSALLSLSLSMSLSTPGDVQSQKATNSIK